MPSTDGTQTNADMVAAYLTATSPTAAQRVRSRLSARYAILNAEVTLDFFGVIAEWARHYPGQFQRFVFETGPGGVRLPLKIYLPEYYRTMAVRMYNFDARAIVASPEVSIFTTKLVRGDAGLDFETVVSEHKFPTEEKAREYVEHHSGETMIFGSRDPMVSCVNVDELPDVKRVFASSERDSLRVVKVFELTP